ncbi:MAG: hypothetical protein ABSC73_02880 [Acidimicrobiales bacterium]
MFSDEPIVLECCWVHATGHDVAKPTVEQLFDGGPVIRRRETLRDLGVELFDLADDLSLGPAVDNLATTSSVLPAEMDRTDPAAVGVTAVDRAFAVPAALGSVSIRGHANTPRNHGYIFGYIPGDKLVGPVTDEK